MEFLATRVEGLGGRRNASEPRLLSTAWWSPQGLNAGPRATSAEGFDGPPALRDGL